MRLLALTIVLVGCGPGKITLPFAAQLGAAPFSCSATPLVGTPPSVFRPEDMRLYISELRSVDASGHETVIAVDEDGLFQHTNVTLLDFEDKTGSCTVGTSETHTTITGSGDRYTKLRFSIGLPSDVNHADLSNAEAPLNVPSMSWGWTAGYRFTKIEGGTGATPSSPDIFNVHVGSTGCASDSNHVTTCTHENKVAVELSITPGQTVLLDLDALLAGTDVSYNTDNTGPGCMSEDNDPDCAQIFAHLGLDLATGQMLPTGQTFARVQ